MKKAVRTLQVSVIVLHDAGIAQLVEHDLAKVGVASSSLVSRSIVPKLFQIMTPNPLRLVA